MPLVQVFTSAPAPSPTAQKTLLSGLSQLLAARFHKPEQWVMTCLCPDLAMTFGGDPAPAAFVAVKNVGKMTAGDTGGLSAAICDRLASGLGVARERVYIEFTDAVGYLWGWNGETFG
jgi:phenylpyruvate tautomerase